MSSLKQRAIQFAFDRYFRWRIGELMAPTPVAVLDYPVSPEPRYGYGKPPHDGLYRVLSRNRASYMRRLTNFLAISDLIGEIASAAGADEPDGSPSFRNAFFSGLDAVALMGLLLEFRPRLLLEIGSGNSTRFARRAIRHFGLATRIVSCDPTPRVEIGAVSDEVIRAPAEAVPLSVFTQLAAGDILFVDGSHQVFQNSDVTVLFLEILPALKHGVIVHFHDIFLPCDYPPNWRDRFYSEQYILAASMLANPGRLEILLSNAFVSGDAELAAAVEPIWAIPGMAEFKADEFGSMGSSIWLRIAQGSGSGIPAQTNERKG
jgi:hypothetical protein